MKSGKKTPRLRDVARVAKVSAATVSRIATGSALVDAESSSEYEQQRVESVSI